MTIATLGGVPLLASGPVRWVLREGTNPHEEVFDLSPNDAAQLMASARNPQTLIIDDQNGTKLTVDKLWVVEQVPGDNPFISKVKVVDRRYWLPYFNFLGRFNMRRNVGFRRVGNSPTDQLNPVVPKIWYWPWSLKLANGTPPGDKWKASEILEEFVRQLEEWEATERPGSGGHVIPSALKNLDGQSLVDNMNIDDSGDAALARLLGVYPSAGVYIDLTGRYVFFNRASGTEDILVGDSPDSPDGSKKGGLLGSLIVGSGNFRKVENQLTRPRMIEVYFSMEVEVRHDYIGVVDGGTVTNDPPVPDVRTLENVAPVPDFSVDIPVNGLGSQTYSQHSWVDIDRLLNADEWSNHPGEGGGPVTQLMIQQAAMPYLDLWGALLITGVRDPDSNWAARVATLQQHWRRSFRVSDTWMSRTLSIKARRCAIIDPTTGTWAPSAVYCNHSFLGTVRSFFKKLKAGNHQLDYAINIPGYPVDGDQVPGLSSAPGALKLAEDSKAAPVIVEIVDGDQGVLAFNFQAEKNHLYEACLPGQIVRLDGSAFSPRADWSDPRNFAVGFDMVTTNTQIPRLEGGWKAAVILSHVPASPNDKRQLYKITVTPDQVKNRLPGTAQASLDKAFGPTWQIRVGAGMEGAKALVQWFDDRAEDIEAIFGIGGRAPNLDGLVVNHTGQGALKQSAISLSEIALALAAQVYSRFTDHQEGSGKGYINDAIEPDGWVGSVAHEVSPRGETTTEVRMKEVVQELSLLSLMDSSTRAILLKLPHVDRQ